MDLRFNVRKAASMVGRSDKLIRDAEAAGRLPPPDKDPDTDRRTGYSLAQVNTMHEVFGTLPHRAPDDPAMVLANLGLYDAEYEFCRAYGPRQHRCFGPAAPRD